LASLPLLLPVRLQTLLWLRRLRLRRLRVGPLLVVDGTPIGGSGPSAPR